MSKPVAGVPIAFRSVLLILGMSIPFAVLFISSRALALAVLPSVLIATDWEKEFFVQMQHSIAVTKKEYFMTKCFHQIYKKNGRLNDTKMLVFTKKFSFKTQATREKHEIYRRFSG